MSQRRAISADQDTSNRDDGDSHSITIDKATLDSSTRRVDLDMLMVLLTWAMFVFHVNRFFDFSPYPLYLGPGKDTAFSYHTEALSIGLITWLLPMFFFLSGMSSNILLESKGPLQFIKERTLRLLIPSISTFFIIIVPQHYILYEWNNSTPFFAWYIYFLKHNLTLGHVWFLVALYAFSLLLLPIFLSFIRPQTRMYYISLALILATSVLAYILSSIWFVLAIIATYPAVLYAAYVLHRNHVTDDVQQGKIAVQLIAWIALVNIFMYTIPNDVSMPESATKVGNQNLHQVVLLLVYFAVFYMCGFIVNRFEVGISRVVSNLLSRLKWWAPIFFCFLPLLFPRVGGPSDFFYAIAHLSCYRSRSYRFFITLYAWSAMFLLYWIVRSGWRDSHVSRVLRMLRRSSLWVFEWHLFPQFYLIVSLRYAEISAVVKYGLVIVGSSLATIVGWYAIDSNPITRVLFGIK